MKKSMYLAWLKFLILIFCVQLLSCSSSDESADDNIVTPQATGRAQKSEQYVDASTNTPPDSDGQLRDNADDEVVVCAPEYDESFKFIFSPDTDDGKECLMDMLNAIYCNDPENRADKNDRGFRIRDAELLMNHRPTQDSVDLIFDIKCRLYLSDHDLTKHTETSNPSPVYYLDIEMQRKKQADYTERMHNYNARSITESIAGAVQPSKYDAISLDESNVKIRSLSFLKQSLRKDLFTLFHEIPAFTNSFMVRGKIKQAVLEQASTDKVINTYAQLNEIKKLDAKISILEKEAQNEASAGVRDSDKMLIIENLKKTREWLSFINLAGKDARRTTKYRIHKSHFTNPIIQKALDRLVAFTSTEAYREMVAQGDSEDVMEASLRAKRIEGWNEAQRVAAVNAVNLALGLKCSIEEAKDMAKKYYPDQYRLIDSLVLNDNGEIISQQGDAQDSVREEDTMKRKHSSDPQVQQSSGPDPGAPQRKRLKKGSSENQKIDEIENTKESSKKSKKNSKKIQESTANTKQPIEEDEGDGSTQRKRKKGSKK